METVTKWEEVLSNLLILERYRNSKRADVVEFYVELIRRGRCFVVYSRQAEFFLGPSRFVGYGSNTMMLHQANKSKDGTVTNAAIKTIFKRSPSENSLAEKAYLDLCSDSGVLPTRIGRKYWFQSTEQRNG